MSEKTDISNWRSASPFWMSLLLIPFAWVGAVFGGWWVLILPIMTWHLFSIIDTFVGLSQANADPNTDDTQLVWYRWITIIWAPLQAVTLFALIWY
ncbi:MAG: alkane 1-monooxygenase, partial [Planktomarina sp.]